MSIRKASTLGWILLLTVAVCSCGRHAYRYRAPGATHAGIDTGNLGDVGLDTPWMEQTTRQVLSGEYPNVHGLLVWKDGKLVYEEYFSGEDQAWGRPLGFADHSREDLHDIRSISKSVVSACIGIALARHLLDSVDQPVYSFFPEYRNLDTGLHRQITIRHLLTMSSGLAWTEGSDAGENCEALMEHSDNPIPFILGRPMACPPGVTWNYNSGGTQVLATILEKVSGEDIYAFARKYLFEPLGITDHRWVKMDGGAYAAASGLRLRPLDLLKFALLYEGRGSWQGRRIVPAAWVDSSFANHINRPASTGSGGYGYQFWIDEDTLATGEAVTSAVAKGNGGQRIYFLPRFHMIVVVTSGNYNRPDRSRELVLHGVLGALEGPRAKQ